MTPEQLKKLAEFGAEYLGWKHAYHPPIKSKYFDADHEYDWGDTAVDNFFNDPMMASYSMHLAQEKLEKEGFDCEYNQQVGIHLWEFNMSLDYDRPVARAENKNKFIAFWEAVQEAKGGNK